MFSDFWDWNGDVDFDPEEGNGESGEWDTEEGEDPEDRESGEECVHGEDDGDSQISFGGSGSCSICDCSAYMSPLRGDICRNCGHHSKFH